MRVMPGAYDGLVCLRIDVGREVCGGVSLEQVVGKRRVGWVVTGVGLIRLKAWPFHPF